MKKALLTLMIGFLALTSFSQVGFSRSKVLQGLEKELATVEEKINKETSTINKKDSQIASLARTIDNLNEDIRDRQAQINIANKIIANTSGIYSEEAIKNAQKDVDSLNRAIKDKTSKRDKAKKEVDKLGQELDPLYDRKNNLEDQANSLKQQINAINDEAGAAIDELLAEDTATAEAEATELRAKCEADNNCDDPLVAAQLAGAEEQRDNLICQQRPEAKDCQDIKQEREDANLAQAAENATKSEARLEQLKAQCAQEQGANKELCERELDNAELDAAYWNCAAAEKDSEACKEADRQFAEADKAAKAAAAGEEISFTHPDARAGDPNSGRLIFDGPGLRQGAVLTESYLDDGISKERDIKTLIINWTNFLLSIIAVIEVVALVWAGFLYITAFGDDSRAESAKKIIIWVVIGILVILAAYAIVNTVMQAVF